MEGQENIQEILTKQLVLCQYLCALAILREGMKWKYYILCVHTDNICDRLQENLM